MEVRDTGPVTGRRHRAGAGREQSTDGGEGGLTTMRRVMLAVCGILAMLVGGASLAWACSPQAEVYLYPTEGRPGDTILVEGRRFNEGTVQIYWTNDAGERTHLTSAQGPSFKQEVQVPASASPDVYYVTGVWSHDGTTYDSTKSFVVQGETSSTSDSGSEEGGEGSMTLSGGDSSSDTSGDTTDSQTSQDTDSTESQSSDTSDGQTEDSSGTQSSPADGTTSEDSPSSPDSTDGSQTTSDSPATSQDTSQDPQPASGTEAGAEQGSRPADGSANTREQPAGTAGSSPPDSAPAPAQPADSEAQPAAATAAEPAEAGSEDSAQVAGQAAGERQVTAPVVAYRPPSEAQPAAQAPAPSARGASADLWSGFEMRDEPASLASRLTDGPMVEGPGAPSSSLTGALALIGTGLLALFATAGTAALRRRRGLVSRRR